MSAQETLARYISSPNALISISILLLSILLVSRWLRTSKNRPPGPFGWPIVGNIFGLSLKGAWYSLTELSAVYGDLIFFHGLGNNLLVLNSLDAISDLLEKRPQNYSHRPIFTFVGELMGLNKGMPLQEYGEEWREQRRIAHVALSPSAVKQYYTLQERLALSLCQDIIDRPTEFFTSVRLAAGRIVVAVTYGIDVKTGQDELVTRAEETMELIGKATVPGAYLCDLIPALKHLPRWMPFHQEAAIGKKMLDDLVSIPFAQVQKEISCGESMPSLARDFLSEEEVSHRRASEDTVKWAAGSMYGAGAETTYATVLTFVMVMALYPEKQQKASEEMQRVVGENRVPKISDKADLPYLGALIKETSRWHPVLPMSIARRTASDDYYRGFYIPKGTIVVPNVWAIAFAPNSKYDPQQFIPERFLDPSVQQVDPNSWNFGFGRRICPGKALAENSVFILIASLLWTFKISVNPKEPIHPSFTESLVSYPKPFKCSITPRSKHCERHIREASSKQ